MEKSEIINFLGSEETYEKYRQLVIAELKRQIELKGLTTHFEGTNVYEQFADFYIQGWIKGNQRLVDEINEKKNTDFSEEEISQYISKHPIIPQEIQELQFQEKLLMFTGEKLSPDLKQQIECYFNNPKLLSEEDARALMTQENQRIISELTSYFDLQHFEQDLEVHKSHGFLVVESNPKDFDINRRGIKSILRENTGSKPSMSEQLEDESCDFDVSAEQSVIAGLLNDYPFILVYHPNQEYPEGMLRSEFIQNTNNNEFIAEATEQLEALYNRYKGCVDFETLSRRVLDAIMDKNRGE